MTYDETLVKKCLISPFLFDPACPAIALATAEAHNFDNDNVYVAYGVAKNVPLEDIFRGVFPKLIALLACNLILLIFPQIALFLPGLMP